MNKWVKGLICVVLGVLWWGPLADFATRPGYNSVLVFAVFVLVGTPLHIKAFLEYNKIVKLTRRAEHAGLAERGSILTAVNQRFRYTVRSFESFYNVVLAVFSFWTVGHPSLGHNRNYGKLVLTYFFGTILATAYLTYRDLHVLRILRKIDREEMAGHIDPFDGTDQASS